jgi:8-oxo-dGTP pyrophosphatase MutT (NUDIX family)
MGPLLDQLDRYEPQSPEEAEHKARMTEFAAGRADPFDRRHLEGHFTASGLVLADSGEGVVLLHHRKLDRWVQPGGHAEPGETRGEELALREAREETAVPDLRLHPSAARPVHIEILAVPALGAEPAHEHFDLRYVLLAPRRRQLRDPGPEAHAVRWFGWEELTGLGLDPGLLRALARARLVVAPPPE